MGNTSEHKKNTVDSRKAGHLCLGILAHVDAGKTTLSEGILYKTGSIRKVGRVDHGDAFLDTEEMEKARGITIFSKQAVFSLGDMGITLLDTPGHVDFSAEMERTLQVLDYAVLVISGADGVQGHAQTLWKLLRQYQVPVFLFVNKMDQPGTDKEALLKELKSRLDENCVDFGEGRDQEEFLESLALSNEKLMEQYLETGEIHQEEICELIRERKVFPCYFGSALKMTGVEEFLEGMQQYLQVPLYPETFGAKIFKITRDSQGKRLTHMKITGGKLQVKTMLTGGNDQENSWQEKADELRVYSGAKYESLQEVSAGMVCAVAGLTKTYPGEGLGGEKATGSPVLAPVLTYRVELPEGCDSHRMIQCLRQLEEEEPLLHVKWMEDVEEIHVQVMGEVQIEILKSLILTRFGWEVNFGQGNLVYKETILEPVEGVGHYEPLRHYAEVHLLLEPGARGSGLQFESVCSTDVLDLNWQRLILTHLAEKEHRGVLTGGAITDMKITLLSGKAHLKHTEGGDFRQATYRAVRQGLCQAKSCLLEPWYEFRLEIPQENLGKAMADLQRMEAKTEPPQIEGAWAVLTGSVPVAAMGDYQRQVISYTRGRGKLSCSFQGYEPCSRAKEVIEQMAYDPERDLENPTGSVFCAHGAGFVVPWDQVKEYMHLESAWKPEGDREAQEPRIIRREVPSAPDTSSAGYQDEKELEEIFRRTYGGAREAEQAPKRWGLGKRKSPAVSGENSGGGNGRSSRNREPREEYLLVDGYNIIFAWKELKELAEASIDGARSKLMDILCNYQGFCKCTLIVVFDAYRVQGHACEISKYHNIHVVYTAEAETADQYIEKTVHEIGKKYQVTVATSDRLEQVIILGQGGRRLSAGDFWEEVQRVNGQIREELLEKKESSRQYLFSGLPQELARELEELRLKEQGK